MTVLSLPSCSEFDAVFENPDAKASTRDFLILARAKGDAVSNRIGFVTSKKKIKRAVDRNRFRRVIREHLRHQAPHPFADYVIIARQTPSELWNAEFQIQLNYVFTKVFNRLKQFKKS